MPSGEPPLARDSARRIDEACEHFEQAWKAGAPLAIEDFLAAAAAADRARLFGELLRLELDYRRRAGQQPSADEYRARFPDRAAEIERAFQPQPPTHGHRAAGGNTPTVVLARGAGAGRAALPAGTQCGHFELLDVLGAGAFGTVYLARDLVLDRKVALKVPKPGVLPDREHKDLFLREARVAAQLAHANIVTVFEVAEDGDTVYIAYELVAGETLRDRLTKLGRLSYREAAALVAKLARVLHYAHQRGVVHRDVKPENIMLDAAGEPRIMDFGIARQPLATADSDDAWGYVGTPSYMSPEQIEGDRNKVRAPSDQWSLGIVLYELLTGLLPFEGEGPGLFVAILERPPTPLRECDPAIPPPLEAICLRCLEKRPERRFPTCQDLAETLEQWLDKTAKKPDGGNEPPPAAPSRRRLLWAAAALAGVAALAAALVGPWLQPPHDAQPAGFAVALQSGDDMRLGSEAILRTGDRFRVVVESDQAKDLAMLQLTSDGNIIEVDVCGDEARGRKRLPIEPHTRYVLPHAMPDGYELTPPAGAELLIVVTADDAAGLEAALVELKAEAQRVAGPIGLSADLLADAAKRGPVKVNADDAARAKVNAVKQLSKALLGEDRVLVVWNLPPPKEDRLPGLE